jgi:predicted ATPase
MALLERERELEMVQAGLVEARSGHGCVVVVEGVAGIGKTALVTALCTQARDEGIVALTAVSWSRSCRSLWFGSFSNRPCGPRL